MKLYLSDRFVKGMSRKMLTDVILMRTPEADVEKLASSIVEKGKGKPYIEGYDYFSISHTGNYWGVIFDDEECGLDIQLSTDVKFEDIAKRVFNEYEIKCVSEYGKDAFFHIWTRREALVKVAAGSVFRDTPPVIVENYADDIVIWYGDRKFYIRSMCISDGLTDYEDFLYIAIATSKVENLEICWV